jgi:phage terminase large subunit-like protein
MSRVAGQRQKPKDVTRAAVKRGRRPTVVEIEPLFHTYDAPKPAGAVFDAKAADRAVRWIETNLRHFKGRWAGAPFYLMAWQKRLVRELFGWKRDDGSRLYRTCYVEAPRKSGKSSLASAIALYLAHGDGEAAPEVACAAFDREQAAIVYNTARFMLEQSPELHAATAIYNSRREMQLRNNPGGWVRALSRESAAQFGLNLHGLVFDELMTQKTRDMWDALTTSQGSREQPLTFCISTAGWDHNSVCFDQHEFVRQISEGTTEAPTFLGVVYGAPVDADWTDEAVWRAANPSLGETASLDFYREQCARAQAVPAEQNTFRTLLLSQWVGQPETFFDMRLWDRCAEVPTSERGLAFGGLDLSATTDLTAFTVVCEQAGALDVYCWAFLPAEGIVERERRDRAPYRQWAEQGSLILTPGATVDYGVVKAAVLEAAGLFDLRDIGYDRWNSSHLVGELADEGVVMVQIGQGFAGLSAGTKELLRHVTDGALRHGADPLLRWCASNAAAQTDPAGNVKPDKSRSAARIDPIVALVMAVDGWMRRGREVKRVSVYSKRYELFREQGEAA